MGNAFNLLHAKLRDVISRMGYISPLPIQEKAIPVILRRNNTLIMSPTGSGKTEAALFPVISMMLDLIERKKGLNGELLAVYVTPLRALNRDIEWRMRSIVEGVGLTISIRHGDTGARDRKRFYKYPPHLVVTTPESLNLLLSVPDRRDVWRNVKWVIIDEIHELLDNKRGVELAVVLERLRRLSRGKIQRIGLSATLSGKSIEEAKKLLSYDRIVKVIEDDSLKKYSIEVKVAKLEDKKGVEGDVWSSIITEIIDVINSVNGSVLVFTNTRSTAEKLAAELSAKLGGGVRVHHGSLSRVVREESERVFREGRVKVLVATSSMELGIDIGHIDVVVQFMSPRQSIVMVQRAGRAGHKLDTVSRAVIVTIDNLYEILESGVIAFRAERGYIEDLILPRKSYDALSHQIAGMVIEGTARSLYDVYEVVSSTLPYSDITIEEIDRVVEHLESVRVIKKDGKSLKQGRRARSYFYRISMIPDEIYFKVIDLVSNSKIGELSERFIEIASMEKEGKFKFILAGKIWEVVDIDFELNKIIAKQVADLEGAIPVWEGELIPVDYKVAREVCSLIELGMIDVEAFSHLLKARKIDSSTINKLASILDATKKSWGGVVLTRANPVIEYLGNGVSILYACLGSKGNFGLALLLSKLISQRVNVEFDYIPYAIVFKSLSGVSGDIVRWAILQAKGLDSIERRAMISDSLRNTHTYTLRFLHVAKRMGVVDPDKSIPYELLRRLKEGFRGTVLDEETTREIIYDKIDFNAIDEFLDSINEPIVVNTTDVSPLARNVLENPYMKRDITGNIKRIAVEHVLDSIKRRISEKIVLLQCAMCATTWKTRVRDISGSMIKCPKCKSSLIAPLPDTEWGNETAKYYKEFKRKGGSVAKSEEVRKRVREVMDRAHLYINYASYGRGRYVIEALMTQGVGPKKAVRVLNELNIGGESRFYESLLKAQEEYITTRKYWDKK
ncbi:MAG: DEAD/DEAH box helicase [Desulfurococcales archaeon]|nr:DEAD/DEAH box helicase [Desulfurococcales archaeon]